MEGAVRFIKNHKDLNKVPLIAYGFSMGSAACILAQARDKDLFDALILICSFRFN